MSFYWGAGGHYNLCITQGCTSRHGEPFWLGVFSLYKWIRPSKINCVFWVTSLVPIPVSNCKTHTIYIQWKNVTFRLPMMWTYCCGLIMYERFSTCSISKAKFCEIWKLMHFFLKNVCAFFSLCVCVCFFYLASSFLLENVLTQNAHFILNGLRQSHCTGTTLLST